MLRLIDPLGSFHRIIKSFQLLIKFNFYSKYDVLQKLNSRGRKSFTHTVSKFRYSQVLNASHCIYLKCVYFVKYNLKLVELIIVQVC